MKKIITTFFVAWLSLMSVAPTVAQASEIQSSNPSQNTTIASQTTPQTGSEAVSISLFGWYDFWSQVKEVLAWVVGVGVIVVGVGSIVG